MQVRDFLTVAEAATELGISPRTLAYRLQHGLMQGERVGARLWLIPRAEVERFRGRGKISPPGRPRRSRSG